ncbi:hypothetical protein Poly24_06530 [Rosistilla carotiformis]|uniref:Uncharacterized protein n=1 Tax=Rosistilla carotiformis TaxID=2528017 RepID=A0A518JN42_9BACT|nr:DUF1580 domain-containing protein [Rosistilla carotiformis]QDV66963.1 hypothetical protein Poly24_06530 [Rosistilla carotiformis]
MTSSSHYLPLHSAVEQVINAPVNRVTAWRWATRPNRYGVQLQSWIIGGKRRTTVAAAERYIAESTAAANAAPRS